MSYFGDGSLSQKILDAVKYEVDNESNIEIIKALAEVMLYYAE